MSWPNWHKPLPQKQPGMDKRLLIIYYNFPPVKVPGAVRAWHFYREAIKHFGHVSVLTAANRRYFTQDPALETGCAHIHEVPAWDARRLLARVGKDDRPYFSGQLKKHWGVRWAQRLLNSFPFNLLAGDGGAWYIWKGYQKGCQLVESQGITHLFSTFRPYADHCIAHLLKRRYPHLVWAADFRDLHVDPSNPNTFWASLQLRANRSILAKADLLTTVSQGLKQELAQFGPPVKVLRNGISQARLAPNDEPWPEQFTIAYTGSLYPGQQDASPLLSALRSLINDGQLRGADLCLRYRGKDAGTWQQWVQAWGLQPYSDCGGVVSLEQAHHIQRTAAVNLLLTWSTAHISGILTGKLFEYLAAQRPVAALINGPGDTELQHILTTLPHSFIHARHADPAQLKTHLLGLYQAWAAEAPAHIPLSAVTPYTWEAQSPAFFQYFLSAPPAGRPAK